MAESNFSPEVIQTLHEKGHEIEVMFDGSVFGRGQIIWRMENGVYIGGTDPRTDGQVAAW